MCAMLLFTELYSETSLGYSNVLSQFAQMYIVHVDKCGNFDNHMIPVITSSFFVSHLTVWQSWHVDWFDVH
jgi:hypothetical protein